jgi:plastocyanin
MRPTPGFLLGGVVLAVASTALVAQLATSFKSPPARPVAVAGPGTPSTAAADISGFAFPSIVTVAVDGTVTWWNADSASHTVTFDDPGLTSQDVTGGAKVSVHFRHKGTYTYHCDIHSSMTGSVEVLAATTTAESTDPYDPYGDSK